VPRESLTFESIKQDEEINRYIRMGNEHLGVVGYTEHGIRHAELVASIARNVLRRLDYPDRIAELAAIAGYLHDMGNVISRHEHASTGAVMAWQVLRSKGMAPEELGQVASAIGNHEEEYGQPVNSVTAALILGDKSDVHRSRVRVPDPTQFDIHDRVNYAVKRSFLRVDAENRLIALELEIATDISPVMNYFEIFLSRMLMCRRASTALDQDFALIINGMRLL